MRVTAEQQIHIEQLKVLAQSRRVASRVAVDGGWDAFPSSERIQAIRLRGARGEVAFRVGGSLVFPGDVMMNLPHLPGFEGFLWRLLGSTGNDPPLDTARRTDGHDGPNEGSAGRDPDKRLEQTDPG